MARNKAFDPDRVLDVAQKCFARHGYEATSIDDLVQRTGLSRASLYNTFGDKHRLFEAVLDRYEARQLEIVAGHIRNAVSPRDAVRRLLVSSVDEECRMGCLLVNSGLELGSSDAAMKKRMEGALQGLETLLRQVVSQIPTVKDADYTASLLVMSVLGLRVLARAGIQRKRILGLADKTIEKILPG